MRIFGTTVLFCILGLAVGYLLFGKVNGDYIPLDSLIFGAKNFFQNLGHHIIGIKTIRQNILISGGIGAIIGLAFSLALGNGKIRRRR